MQIKVKNTTGKENTYEVEQDSTISYLKSLIEETEGIPPDQQRLIFKGKNLVDSSTITASGVKAGDSLHLILALRAGF